MSCDNKSQRNIRKLPINMSKIYFCLSFPNRYWTNLPLTLPTNTNNNHVQWHTIGSYPWIQTAFSSPSDCYDTRGDRTYYGWDGDNPSVEDSPWKIWWEVWGSKWPCDSHSGWVCCDWWVSVALLFPFYLHADLSIKPLFYSSLCYKTNIQGVWAKWFL